SIEQLQQAGYVYVGIDHFAKPKDSLVETQQAGKRQRDFQGYSTHGYCDLLSFGVSSISTFGNVCLQNSKQLDDYYHRIDQQQPAFVRGFTLSKEDLLRQRVINQLICHFHLDFQPIQEEFGIAPTEYFPNELAELQPMVQDGLISIDGKGI